MLKSFDLAGNGEPDQVQLGVQCWQGWASKGLWMNLLGTVNDDHPKNAPHTVGDKTVPMFVTFGKTDLYHWK